MFFNRIFRNVLIVSLPFILLVNIYTWITISAEGGTYEYRGFYMFAQNLSTFPLFEYFVKSFNEFCKVFIDWNGLKVALAVLTAGLSFICEFLIGIIKMASALIMDFIQIVVWLFKFLGIVPYEGLQI